MNIWGCDLTKSELLGYHVNKEHSSALNYTRDCLSRPMRDMITVMRQINLGVFNPAAPRDQVSSAVAKKAYCPALPGSHRPQCDCSPKQSQGMGTLWKADICRFRGPHRLLVFIGDASKLRDHHEPQSWAREQRVGTGTSPASCRAFKNSISQGLPSKPKVGTTMGMNTVARSFERAVFVRLSAPS